MKTKKKCEQKLGQFRKETKVWKGKGGWREPIPKIS